MNARSEKLGGSPASGCGRIVDIVVINPRGGRTGHPELFPWNGSSENSEGEIGKSDACRFVSCQPNWGYSRKSASVR
jgi:hypothetical protein